MGLCVSLCGAALYAQQIPEPNVNMVAGTSWPHGDPFLQRQNEPSVAVSTRNPLHLLAGANDYRSVDIPFDTPASPDNEERGDAWLGVFKSRNGGATWWSDLLPGYPQDSSPAGLASPIHGFQAAADPVVRAGANGMFYYSGIVLNRDTNPLGAVFVARFIDNNNTENGDPIRLIDSSVIDKGTAGAFIDKPWIAVAPGSGQCTVNGQTFPAQNVYLAYTVFVGGTNNLRTKLMFTRSTDCGATWGQPTKLSEEQAINQGATIAVAPNGTIYVVWRRFRNTNQSNAILVAKSTDQGKTFVKSSVVANINPFEQGMTYYSIRTNAYPSAAVDDSNNVYVAWADRGFEPNGDGRIVMMRSADGTTWSGPTVVDGGPKRGSQFMPAITAVGGKVVVAYYDLRDDDELRYYTPIPHSGGVYNEHEQPVADLPAHPELVFTQYLMDVAHHRRHTLDLRAAQASTSVMPTAFDGFTRVSHYAFGSRPPQNPATLCELGPGCIEQLQYNPPNLPMFRLGTAPFIGDYIDLTGYASGNERVLHAVWTDNRDVRPPADGNWANYTPVHLGTATSTFGGGTEPNCVAGQTGMRNQNIYTARITNGVFASSPGNSKQLLDKNGQPITRAFVVYVQNATSDKNGRTFELTLTQPTSGWASFDQFDHSKTSVDVTIPPRSSVARSVFVNSTFDHASVQVNIAEGSGGVLVPNGLTATVVINPDVSNPDVSNPDVSNPDVSNPDVSNPDVSNPDVSNVEVHNPDVSNPDVSNPDVSNPDVSNPDVSNPDVSNPDVSNPDVSNPDVSNPDVSNPDVSNPDVSNPDVSNTSVSDTTWTTHNKGNTTSGYNIKLATTTPIPNGVRTQLIINRIYQTPVARDCVLGVENHRQIISNVLDPTIGTINQIATLAPAATLWLAPGDAARITLRVYNPTPLTTPFNPATAVAPVVVAEAVNSDDAQHGITTPQFAIPLVITTTSVNDAVAGQSYSTPMAATGGKSPYNWTVSPATLTFNTGNLMGTFQNPGDVPVTVTVTDSAIPPHVTTASFTVHVYPPITFTSATVPAATQGAQYSTQLTATGGKAPLHWVAGGGTLPGGLTLSDGGLISGTPAFGGVSTFSLQITDSSQPPHTITTSPVNLTVTGCGPTVTTLFDNTNIDPVTNGANAPNFTASQPVCLDSIVTYHWNNGQGVTPGTIGLFGPNQQQFGPWQAAGSAGQGGAPNVNWTATPPSTVVLSGTYTVIDSDSKTWSQNAGSNGLGFTKVFVRAYTSPLYTVTAHMTYNGAPRTPTTPPQFFLRNEGTGQPQPGATVVWNGNDTFTISGLPTGTFGVEAASKEGATAVFYPGSFYSFTDFDAATAAANGFTVTLNRVIHTTAPADNATTFAAYACPPALSVNAPTQFNWDAIDVSATYSWQITKYSCSNGTPTAIDSGTVNGTSLTLPSALPATASGEYYTFTITAFSTVSPSIPVGEIMTNGTDWHGWDLRFTVPPSTVAKLPTVAAGFGQLEVFDVSGLFTTDGASVHFVDQNGTGADGFLFHSPSTASRLYVRLPAGLANGPLTATVNFNGSPVASTSITQSTTPGAPIIQAIRNNSTGDCTGTLNPTPTTTINAGQGIAVSGFGTDTVGAEVQFMQNGVPTIVGSSCAEDSASIGEAAIVSVPQTLSGSVDVSIRTTVNGVTSAWSQPVTVTVIPPIP